MLKMQSKKAITHLELTFQMDYGTQERQKARFLNVGEPESARRTYESVDRALSSDGETMQALRSLSMRLLELQWSVIWRTQLR